MTRSSSKLTAALLFAAFALAGCSGPTVADACRNVCICRPSCGFVGVEQPEATCEANGLAEQQAADAVGCRPEYDAYVACIYEAACKDLAQGCNAEFQTFIGCEPHPGPDRGG